ncbi:hypothetical protein PHLCEN_2v12060 [Hermanssonia centrifuga]|uniref:T6SS Phospholipase effector Tle1-like catalytic domain-containing protein n=1 Tax=Hermanssonia centrifuga TaxID=98765 RepID=A0A2R6NI91_9APHY|nr:hypothetical protein PHLCEN_2v12060 [Hermanssonia centrifuga]
MFTRTDDLGWAQSTAFKKAFSIDVDIEFIGVWDTVCSVGLIPRRLPFTTSNTSVRTFRHAVSLDERRAKFKANLFNRPTEKEAQLGTHAGDMPKAGVDDTIDAIDTNLTTVQPQPDGVIPTATQKGKKQDGKPGKKPKAKNTQQELERQFSMQGAQLETDVLEVWFTGCHCGTSTSNSSSLCRTLTRLTIDVGGGSVSNDTPHNLARIPLRWMIRQCFLTNTGIRFHSELLPNAGLDPASLYPVVLPRPPAIYTSPSVPSPSHTRDNTARTLVNYADATPSVLTEEEHDLADALCPIYDQLVIAPAWWILEILPIKHREQREDDTWHSALTVNLGHGRKIPKQKRQGFFVHRSVKIRMETEGLAGGPYTPHARFKVEPTWVD